MLPAAVAAAVVGVAAVIVGLVGWRSTQAGELEDVVHCNIDRRVGLSAVEFLENYDDKEPVVLLGGINHWPAMQRWSRESLLAQHGDEKIEVGEPKLLPGEIAEGVERTVALKEFVAHMDKREREKASPVMAFDTVEFHHRANLSADTTPPLPQFEHWNATVPYFTWGPAGLGLPFHAHAANFLPLIVGKKSWYLFPPSVSNDTSIRPQPRHSSIEQGYL